MPAPTLSGQLRRSLLLKILSKPAPSREDLSSVIELTATKVVEQLQCQSMTLYLVEGDQIAFRHVYYSPTLWGDDKAKEQQFKQTAEKLLQLKLPKGTGNVGKVIETGQPLFFTSKGPDAASLEEHEHGLRGALDAHRAAEDQHRHRRHPAAQQGDPRRAPTASSNRRTSPSSRRSPSTPPR